MPNLNADLTETEIDDILNFRDNTCSDIKQTDIPTIFIPWILASWYSEYWYEQDKIKRWIPDPITHAYDTLFYSFKQEWYHIKDVFYIDEFKTFTIGNPKQSLYLFWYDWKKDNKITATMLRDLILEIRLKYEELNWCDIETVNIVAHSMWWLVARAMLEDICASREDIKNYYKKNKKWKIKYIRSRTCDNYTRVNKLITISTPQRWSPNSFPMWTKWNINWTTAVGQATVLKAQLWVGKNEDLYKVIHWYDEKIPNGIVTIWQLLPDIANSWEYNEELKYLYKDGEKLERKNHPKNEFLQELNTWENIEKMLWNISGKYTLFYTTKTWYYEKNNIVWYDLEKVFSNWINNYIEDKTQDLKWKDIYDYYLDKSDIELNNINKNIRNNSWLWWDWTVPTNNLALIINNTYKKKELVNNKFEAIEKKCFLNNNKETLISDDLWSFSWDLCSHTKTPTTVAIDVVEEITWNKKYIDNKDAKIKALYSNIWYIDYYTEVEKEQAKKSISGDMKIKTKYKTWIKVDELIDSIIEKNYKKQFKNKEAVDDFFKNRKTWWREKIKWSNLLTEIIRYEIKSPINLIIEDEKWRKIGIDPDTWKIINEIPWAWTSWNTEWSWQKEFFIIPKTWTWELNHKIHSFGTGNWEYHIVIDSLKSIEKENKQKNNRIIIKWNAKKWELEWYDIEIKEKKLEYKKVESNYYNWWSKKQVVKEISLEEKYGNILEKIKVIIKEKYSEKQKKSLKQRLEIFNTNIDKTKFKENEKIRYLVGELVKVL